MGTMVKRDINFNKRNIEKVIKSLRHSLRMAQNEYDKFESDIERRHLNKVQIDGKVIDLNDFDCDKFINDFEKKLLKTIDETSINPEDEKEKNYLRSLRKKINDFSVSNSFEIAEFINNSIENKSVNIEEYSSLLNREGIKRINQKVDLLSRYIAVSNKVSDDKIGDNINRVKEVFLVIPSTNKLPNIDLYGDFTRKTLTEFYKENFKDFDIIITMSHLDETTPHSHIFIDLQNNKTGKYDFSVKELDFAIQYSKNIPNVEKMPLFEDYELKDRTVDKQDYIYRKELNSWKASIVQTAFYDYFNKKSNEIELGYTVEKLAPSKDRDKRNKIIEEEAKKPKADRKFNYYTKQLEDMELKIQSLTNELNNSKEEKNKIKEELNTLNEKFKKGTTAVSKLKTDENKFNNEIESNKNTIKQQEKSIEEQKKSIAHQSKSIEDHKKIIEEQKETIKENNTAIRENKEVFNKEVDRVCDILDSSMDSFIERINKKIGGFEDFYKKISIEVAEAKKSFKDTMDEFVSVMSKMKKISLEFSIMKNNDKRDGILDGFKSLIHWSINGDKKEIKEFYKKSQLEFYETETKTLLLVEQAVNKSQDLDDIKEINPIFKNVVKPVIEERKEDLKLFDTKEKELKSAFNEIRKELKEETKVDRSRFKLKM